MIEKVNPSHPDKLADRIAGAMTDESDQDRARAREVRKMEKLQERNEFLYKTKALLPYKRKEMIVDMLEKSRALMEQELILDAIYNSMDFKGMNAYDTDKYRKSITQLDDLLNYFRRCS